MLGGRKVKNKKVCLTRHISTPSVCAPESSRDSVSSEECCDRAESTVVAGNAKEKQRLV